VQDLPARQHLGIEPAHGRSDLARDHGPGNSALLAFYPVVVLKSLTFFMQAVGSGARNGEKKSSLMTLEASGTGVAGHWRGLQREVASKGERKERPASMAGACPGRRVQAMREGRTLG